MSRSSKALRVNHLPPMPCQIEVMASAATLERHWEPNPLEVEEELRLTLLLSFGANNADRWQARALATSMFGAHTLIEQCIEPGGLDVWISSLVATCGQNQSIGMVLSLPSEWSPVLEQQIADALASIRSTANSWLQLVIGVADRPREWSNCAGIDGFVVAAPNGRGMVALKVFYLLTMWMAPDLSPCMDAEDLRLALGSVVNPSTLWDGVWLTEEAHLVLKDAAILALGKCQGACFATTQMMTLQSQRQLMLACAQFVPHGANVVSSMCDGLYANSENYLDGIAPVIALCKPSEID